MGFLVLYGIYAPTITGSEILTNLNVALLIFAPFQGPYWRSMGRQVVSRLRICPWFFDLTKNNRGLCSQEPKSVRKIGFWQFANAVSKIRKF